MIPWSRLAAKKQSDAQLALLRQVAEGVHGIEAVFDRELRLLWISPSIERVTGMTPQECLAADDILAMLVHESDRAHCRRLITQVVADGVAQDFELRLRRRDGEAAWVASHWRAVAGAEHGAVALRLSAEDIQTRKETEYKLLETVTELRRAQALREHYLLRSNDERQRLAALLNLIRLGIIFMDQDRRVLYYNRAMLEIWGYPLDAHLIGMRESVLQSRAAPLLEDAQAYFAHVAEVLNTRQPISDAYEFRFADGRIVTDRSAVVAGASEGHRIGRVWIYEDVTEARRISAQLISMAERDPLTNIFNRRRFHEELERMLADAARRGTAVGLLGIDLDGFKPINDAFGHQAGDQVLVGLVERVGGVVRRNEMFFRVGGDEFAMLVPDARASAMSELANRLCDSIGGLVFEFDGRQTGVTASIGIALFPDNGFDAESLILAADEAMYRSKAEGRNRWTLSARGGGESARIPASSSDEPDSKED
ncbi:diguanylate cyclase domain-containing protein [Thauera linaloolentis]|uniref:Diguanylate cyclase n=1 Tax=Thauera linaloolentis (strain DSM 12138 / JCM 21573 / CCUG 41526 / CIP 105981 / IAM 15112 / NBRC 102519 / 47Lol) TaxID=1123367 RepID=N6Y836_THAL4|nr:diguanylate cyclase [Thauera linaloolentis]ENO90406.1 diguanylate cyclase [Thauera linaloolentis 47Lol = DSM 12138]MCM8564020.1 diguanylate cyclase [Thauera linaloolentis]